MKMRKKSNDLLSAIRKVAMGAMVCLGMMATTQALTACSSSDDDNKENIEGYLTGSEWTYGKGAGTYSFYKNHLLMYEGTSSVVAGGASENPIFFGTWQIVDNSLTTTITTGHPTKFDKSGLMQGTLRDLHTEQSLTYDIVGIGKDGSVSMKQDKPYIIGTASDGKLYALNYHKNMFDNSDASAHDAALHGTWYLQVTEKSTGKSYMAILTFNADGTFHNVIEGKEDYTTTYTTKNGQVTINGYLSQDNTAKLYYINIGFCLKLYSPTYGYLAAILRPSREEAKQ